MVKTDQATAVPENQKPQPFEIMLYVPQFFPHEVLVQIFNKTVRITGKHGEHVDEHGFVSREFTKRYEIPDGVLPEKLRADFTGDGVLIIREMEQELADSEAKSPEKVSIQQKFLEEYESAYKIAESS